MEILGITVDEVMVTRALLIIIAMLLIGAIYATARLVDRNRVRLADDPMLSAHGDQPGFSAEQLRRFKGAVHDPRKPDHRVRA